MAELNLSLHSAQQKVFRSKARFKVVAAGRRFGKTRLAIVQLAVWALGNQTAKKDLFFLAPTFQQAKDVVWSEMKDMLRPVTAAAHENTGVLTLVNGVKIHLKGSDRPDTLRGVGLIAVVIDEYQDMKPNVFEEIISPALADTQGPAFIIGTPKGRSHFYLLTQQAANDTSGEWEYFHFTTLDNPFIPKAEIESQRRRLSSAAFRQEFLASFDAPAGELFKEPWIVWQPQRPQDKDGLFLPTLPVLTADLAGFAAEAEQKLSKNRWLDNSAVCKSHAYRLPIDERNAPLRIWVEDVDIGRWPVRETATRIVRAARDIGTQLVGVERGIAMQAVASHMPDVFLAENYRLQIEMLSHGNKHKADRIVWALQGRIEHGTMTFNDTPGTRTFVDELLQFPSKDTHDDAVDSVAYSAQMVDGYTMTDGPGYYDSWEPLDDGSGY